jgi:hypothetical protein
VHIQELARRLQVQAKEIARSVDCFDFVPSDYETVWTVLSEVRSRFPPEPAPVFCEWGSGLGVVTGMAEILRFRAFGIEIDATLAEQSRGLLKSQGLTSKVITGSYLTMPHSADVIFVYCWPGRMLETEQHFIDTAQEQALLLICHGASDVRCKTKAQLVNEA